MQIAKVNLTPCDVARLSAARCLFCSGDASFALVLESIPVTAEGHDMAVMQRPVERLRRQHGVVGQGAHPSRESQVGCNEGRAGLVASGNHLEQL